MSPRNIYTDEQQNDRRMDELHSKVRSLRSVTTDLYDDAEQQTTYLDDTGLSSDLKTPPSNSALLCPQTPPFHPTALESNTSVSKFDLQTDRRGFYILFWEMPLNEWLELRYCSVYKVHRWVHRRLTRVFLFNAMNISQGFPSKDTFSSVIDVSNRLCRKLPDVVLKIIEELVLYELERGSLEWIVEAIDVTSLSERERALTVIFVDVMWMGIAYNSVHRIGDIMWNPLRTFPDAPDILSLPLLEVRRSRATSIGQSSATVPNLDSSDCVCRGCPLVQSQLMVDLGTFGDTYFHLVKTATSRGCTALKKTWEPVLEQAEEWLEELTRRIEAPSDLFPWTNVRRPGPYLLQTAQDLHIVVGTDPSVERLLQLTAALHSHDARKELDLFESERICRDCLGYTTLVRDGPTEESHLLLVRGGWLVELSGTRFDDEHGAISFLQASESLSIHNNAPAPFLTWRPLWMPVHKPDNPIAFPAYHGQSTASPGLNNDIRPHDLAADVIPHVSIILSNQMADGFPLLFDEKHHEYTYSALIRVFIGRRIIETPYRPTIIQGEKCRHSQKYRSATYCSLPSWRLLSRVHTAEADDAVAVRFPDPYNDHLKRFRTFSQHMGDPGGCFERNRVCIVRCGRNDGPAEPVVALAGAFGKKVYLIHHRECWECALARMRQLFCTVGIASDIKGITMCAQCI